MSFSKNKFVWSGERHGLMVSVEARHFKGPGSNPGEGWYFSRKDGSIQLRKLIKWLTLNGDDKEKKYKYVACSVCKINNRVSQSCSFET